MPLLLANLLNSAAQRTLVLISYKQSFPYNTRPNGIDVPSIVSSFENGKSCAKPPPAGRALRGAGAIGGYEQHGEEEEDEALDVDESAFWGTNASMWAPL